jgi:hypothetical protein
MAQRAVFRASNMRFHSSHLRKKNRRLRDLILCDVVGKVARQGQAATTAAMEKREHKLINL